jgi:hypothetical protein
MNTLATSANCFRVCFWGSLLGFGLRVVLPEDYLSTPSRDLVKLDPRRPSCWRQFAALY